MHFNFEHNSINNNFNVKESNVLAMADKDFSCEINNDSVRFVDEEKAFNEWLESCEETNSIVMNRPFFKLLNLFTEACSVVNNELDYKPLSLSNTNGELNKDKVNDILKTIDDDHSKKITSYVNEEQELHRYDESSSQSNYDCVQQKPLILNKIDSAAQHFFDVDMENTYSEDLFKSQKSDKHINDRNDEEFAAELFNSDNLIRPINRQQKSPIICSSKYMLNTTEPDKNRYSKKIDFNELFKSQRADKHIQSYMEEITDSRERQLSNDTNELQLDVAAIDSSIHFDSDGSTEMVNTVERDDNGGDNENEYDEAMEDINFEDLFKSQRVDECIKKYNDMIFVADQCSDDRNDAIGSINILRKSPIICSGRHKSVSTVDCKSDDDLTGISDQSIISIIDLVVEEDQENVENLARFSRDHLLKSQCKNKNVEDYMETIVVNKNVTRDRGQDVDPAIDDDVISVNGSPEFFSCKLPKKIIETKITDRAHPTDEIIDLLTPPLRSLDCIVDSSTVKDTFLPNEIDSTASQNVKGKDDEVLPWHDEDDMDFMFVDYCSGTGISNTALSVKNEQVNGICNEVFTQKPWTNDVDTSNVFTQKVRVDSVNGSKTMTTQSPLRSTNNTSLNCQTSEDKIAIVSTTAKPSQKGDNAIKSMVQPQSYNGLQSFNFMKTCNLLKPGFSLRRNTASAVQRTTTNDTSPINSPGWRHKPLKFSQSTPKLPAAAVTAKTKQQRKIVDNVNVLFLTSSSDSDVFVEEKTKSRHRIRKKRPSKPKKVSFPHRGNVATISNTNIVLVDNSRLFCL